MESETNSQILPLRTPWVQPFDAAERRDDLVWARVTAMLVAALFHVVIGVLWLVAFLAKEPAQEALAVADTIELELESDEPFKETIVSVPVNPDANQELPQDTANVAEQNQAAAAAEANPEEASDKPVSDGETSVLFALEEGQRELTESTSSLPTGLPIVSEFKREGNAEDLDISITEQPGKDDRAQSALEVAGDYGQRVIVRQENVAPEAENDGRELSPGIEEAPAGITVLPAYENDQTTDKAYVINEGAPTNTDSSPSNRFNIVKIQPELPTDMPEGVPIPSPRPEVKVKKDAGPLIKNEVKPSRIGKDAVDANFNLMGVYGKRMREAYLAQWDILAETYTFSSQDTGSKVDVYFVLTKEGTIKDFEVVNSTATQGATLLIQDAIQSRAPYEPWTQDMIRMFGDEFGFKLSFYYFRVH